ncbi:MAG TPA: ferredoxin [Firmicutes bacterium]|nr:ferredoxin [Bacillota bacterium]
MKTIVDRDVCIGCGACVSIAPEIYEIDDEGISVPIVDQIKAEILSLAEEARDCCPVDAISIVGE